MVTDQGVVTTAAAAGDLGDDFAAAFAAEITRHRAWQRATDSVIA